MHTNLIHSDNLRPEALESEIPFPAFILSLVYLQAGLPPDAAIRSAMADYEQSFSSGGA
jgi:hypothetical protein